MNQQPLVKGYIQPFEVKDIDMQSGTFVQAYTRYDVRDSDGDYGRKGMFTKTWAENFSRIRHLLNHDAGHPVGEPQRFYEDNQYAYVQSKIGSHDDGEDFKKMVDSGLIKEASYGYTVIKKNKMANGSNELLEVKLWEVSSLTGWGVNEFTPIIAFQKSIGNEGFIKQQLDQYAHLKSFFYNSTATDRTLQNIELQIKQIEDSFLELLTSRTQAESSLEPPQETKAAPLDTNAIVALLAIKKHSLQFN